MKSMISIRKATTEDISSVEKIYEDIHSAEESGSLTIGWARGVYPTRATAEAAHKREDLFVLTSQEKVLGAAVINQIQVDVYEGAPWQYEAADSQVMVLHTLVISPNASRKGLGTCFVKFYEDYARANNCLFLRMDTNARNTAARKLYKKLDYDEIGIVPCIFNGIEGVQLVLLEKRLD
ncbi:MAG: GNAT family N-acetyltransferase [Firmicutes bacterium]|nr:GNAT family N-acetyltransferase [Bacillota bacterium]